MKKTFLLFVLYLIIFMTQSAHAAQKKVNLTRSKSVMMRDGVKVYDKLDNAIIAHQFHTIWETDRLITLIYVTIDEEDLKEKHDKVEITFEWIINEEPFSKTTTVAELRNTSTVLELVQKKVLIAICEEPITVSVFAPNAEKVVVETTYDDLMDHSKREQVLFFDVQKWDGKESKKLTRFEYQINGKPFSKITTIDELRNTYTVLDFTEKKVLLAFCEEPITVTVGEQMIKTYPAQMGAALRTVQIFYFDISNCEEKEEDQVALLNYEIDGKPVSKTTTIGELRNTSTVLDLTEKKVLIAICKEPITVTVGEQTIQTKTEYMDTGETDENVQYLEIDVSKWYKKKDEEVILFQYKIDQKNFTKETTVGKLRKIELGQLADVLREKELDPTPKTERKWFSFLHF